MNDREVINLASETAKKNYTVNNKAIAEYVVVLLNKHFSEDSIDESKNEKIDSVDIRISISQIEPESLRSYNRKVIKIKA